jgi:hypothetical protein
MDCRALAMGVWIRRQSRLRRSHRKANSMTDRQRLMRKAVLVVVSVGVVVAMLSWIARSMEPWMPSGRTVQVGAWRFEHYEVQIWQRKNASLTEPFSTAMFVRSAIIKSWRAYTLGFQDCYSPKLVLRGAGSSVDIISGGKKMGRLDLVGGEYFSVGQSQPINEGTTSNPANWWYSP